jgi:ribosomal protein S1
MNESAIGTMIHRFSIDDETETSASVLEREQHAFADFIKQSDLPPPTLADCVDDEPEVGHDFGVVNDIAYGEIHRAIVLGPQGRHGLNVLVGKVKCFLPGHEFFRTEGLRQPIDFRGKNIPVMRLEPRAGKLNSRPLVSHKAAGECVRREFLAKLKQGQMLDGTVVKHVDKQNNGHVDGAIIRFDEINTGYVDKKRAAFDDSQPLEKILPLGTAVSARVVEVQIKKLKLKLSTRKATIPWDKIKAVAVGDVFDGVVMRCIYRELHGQKQLVAHNVRLSDGMIGAIYMSQRGAKIMWPVGSTVKVEVKDKKDRNGLLALSIAPMVKEACSLLQAKLDGGETIKAEVEKVLPSGAFVRVHPLVSAFLPNLNKGSLVLKIGAPVKVKLTRIAFGADKERPEIGCVAAAD